MTNNNEWIRISHASKILRGNYILSNINVSFEKGKIYGIVGDNGSGKTMLLRAISGLMHLSSGAVIYQKAKPTMGIIIENPGFLLDYSGLDNLIFLARIQNVISKDKIKKTMVSVGLDPDDKRKVRAYSLGMKQKLAIAQAIMEEPDMLILDEPFRGLDAKSLDKIRELLIDYNTSGGTIFLTSHNLEDIAMLCDYVYKMADGTLIQLPYDPSLVATSLLP